MSHQHDKPASFHSSPQEAIKAPREDIVYVAGLYEGTGEERPDFLGVVDVDLSDTTRDHPHYRHA